MSWWNTHTTPIHHFKGFIMTKKEMENLRYACKGVDYTSFDFGDMWILDFLIKDITFKRLAENVYEVNMSGFYKENYP